MVTTSKDNSEQEKKNEELLNFSLNMSSEWQLSGTNLANSTMGLIPLSNPMAVCKGDMIDSTSCSRVPMGNSFCPTIWDLPTSSQNLGLSDINVQPNTSISHSFGARPSGLGPLGAGTEKALGMNCTPSNPMLKGGMFLQSVPGMLPPSLAHIPADSGFIERAARFSCFNGGNFGDMMNPFIIPEPVNPYFKSLASMHRPQEISAGNRLKSMPGVQPQKNEMKLAANSEDISFPFDHGGAEGSPLKNERNCEIILAKSQDEAKQGAGASEMGSDGAGFSGRGDEEELEGAGGESSAKGLNSKKRKRICQDAEFDESKGVPQLCTEASNHHTGTQQMEDQNTTSTTIKPGGKNGKQGPQTSDPPKEEYVHVRARRGQATNNHSLAERVRREKISERMKCLQDLVPGCSKVTGKAVMLDEIINYVQSLQRQVEFLSMKLATVNPRLDFNIESLIAKDILQSRAGPSYSLAFSPDMTMQYPVLHPPPTGLIQSGFPGLGSSSDSLRRSISSQFTNSGGGYMESSSQVPSEWEDELHNVIQMGLNSNAPLTSQDLSASLPPGHMKAEL